MNELKLIVDEKLSMLFIMLLFIVILTGELVFTSVVVNKYNFGSCLYKHDTFNISWLISKLFFVSLQILLLISSYILSEN